MEKFVLKEDVTVFCVTAKSFPAGIREAFLTLEKLNPGFYKRYFYGISYFNENGNIVYKAATPETFEGEGKLYGLESFVITKGEYLTETILDFMKHTALIGESFHRLLAAPDADKNYPCVEWYKSDKELLCMVRALQPETAPDKIIR